MILEGELPADVASAAERLVADIDGVVAVHSKLTADRQDDAR